MNKNHEKIRVYFSLLAITLCVVLLVQIIYLQFYPVKSPNFTTYFAARKIVAALFVGPFVETILFQFIIIESMIYIGIRLKHLNLKSIIFFSCIVSAIAFSIAHYLYNGLYNFFVAGIPGGFVLAFLYQYFRNYSKQEAFFYTWMFHATLNLYMHGLFYTYNRILIG
jgi:membrane protease YdiL (CAAX protease family)